MNQQTPPPVYHDDEIDLRKLFQAIGNFFVRIGHGFIRLILAIRRATFRYKILLISAMVLGLIAGVIYNKTAKPYYQTSLVLKSNYFNAKLVENNIDKLNLLCEEENRTGLAKELNISEELAQNIVSFDYEPFIDENDVVEIELLKQKLEDLKIDKKDIDRIIAQIEVENRNTFLIRVFVFDTQIIENLEDALVGFFRNSPYVANRIKVTRSNLEAKIAKLSADVLLLDSLKEAYNLNLRSQASDQNDASGSVVLADNVVVDPVSVYNQGVIIFDRLLQARQAYELGSDFELVDGFTTFTKPESPSLVKAAVMGAVLAVVLAYLLILLIEINKYLNRVEKEGFGS